MLPVPFTLLGARRIVNNITGETSNTQADCGSISPTNWLNSAIPSTSVATVSLGSKSVTVAASSFVAVASYCIDCHKPPDCTPDQLLNNGCDFQRRHIDEDVALWMAAYSPAAYNPAISAAFGAVVKRAGTGPWGAGAWLGDSQYYFLVVWLATTVGKPRPRLLHLRSLLREPGQSVLPPGGLGLRSLHCQRRDVRHDPRGALWPEVAGRHGQRL